MKTFIIRTTTDDNWELCEGIYLVKEETEELAKEKFSKEISKHERILSVEDIDKINETVTCLTSPVVM